MNLTGIPDFAAMNDAYENLFTADPPTRITLGANALTLAVSTGLEATAPVT